MPLPNHHGGSLLNLMSSLGSALGSKSKYEPLQLLPPKELQSSKNIVFMVIDGLGYEYIKNYGKNSTFNKHMRGKITSIFPTITSTAIPTFFTGLAPEEHGMTGWHMYLKEFGSVILSLPYVLRASRSSLGQVKDIKTLFTLKPFADRIKVPSYVITQQKLVDTPFSIATAGKAKKYGYKTMHSYFTTIKKVIRLNNRKKFIHAYYPHHDSLCHKHGSKSKKVLGHFRKLDKELASFLTSIEGTNTAVIITADHGIIDVPKSHRIEVSKHPELAETLALPLCGDFRYAYAYIKPDKTKQFGRYIKQELKHCCTLHKSKDLVKKKYFGLFKPSKRFLDRIGDYIIIMKGTYAIYDFLAHEKSHYNIGDHGGLSKEEMYVPLIVIKS